MPLEFANIFLGCWGFLPLRSESRPKLPKAWELTMPRSPMLPCYCNAIPHQNRGAQRRKPASCPKVKTPANLLPLEPSNRYRWLRGTSTRSFTYSKRVLRGGNSARRGIREVRGRNCLTLGLAAKWRQFLRAANVSFCALACKPPKHCMPEPADCKPGAGGRLSRSLNGNKEECGESSFQSRYIRAGSCAGMRALACNQRIRCQ